MVRCFIYYVYIYITGGGLAPAVDQGRFQSLLPPPLVKHSIVNRSYLN